MEFLGFKTLEFSLEISAYFHQISCTSVIIGKHQRAFRYKEAKYRPTTKNMGGIQQHSQSPLGLHASELNSFATLAPVRGSGR